MSDAAPPFDIAVIGGGVNGTGIARDATGRGARVLLLEKGDLAEGTSSASTKLIHGGLRYLEHYEFALVREALQEREVLWGIAPHLIRPMRFVLPHVSGLRPRWMLRAGLFLYDHIGGRKALPATETVDLQRHAAGAPLKPGFGTGFVYSDCWVDDARLVVLTARDAADRGAEFRTRCEVTALSRQGDVWSIETPQGRFTARAVVNATGPAVLSLIERAHEHADYGMRLVRGSHIVVPRLFEHDHAYFFQLPDGRIFFAIPYEGDFTLIGTTDRDHKPGDPIRAEAEEVEYLCEGANRYFAKAISPTDVVWSYAGVRPLVDDKSGKPEAATRGYRLDLSDAHEGAAMLSVFGGKITTHRHLAQEAVDLLASRLPHLHGHGWTAHAPLPGGDFPKERAAALIAEVSERHAYLTTRWAERLVRAYGLDTMTLLGDARTIGDLGQHFGQGLTEREVEWLVTREWARRADDILWRRTKLGLRFTPAQAQSLDQWLKARGHG